MWWLLGFLVFALVIALAGMWWLLGFLVFALIIVLAGLKVVKQQERWIIEFLGKYNRTLEPGLNWIFPGIMKVRAVVFIWEQTIKLFEEAIKIDFKDGSAVPKGAEVFVKIKDPDDPYGDENETGAYRSIYEIANWRTAVRDLIENALRSFLNRLTIDKAITMGRAGYDLASPRKGTGLPNNELTRIRETLAQWGFDLKRITITDFDLEPELVRARGEVQIRRRKVEVAEQERQVRALETIGSVVQMMAESCGRSPDEIRKQIEADPALRREFLDLAKDLITRKMAISGQSFVDIRVEGAEGLEKTLLGLLAASQRMPKGGGNERQA